MILSTKIYMGVQLDACLIWKEPGKSDDTTTESNSATRPNTYFNIRLNETVWNNANIL